MDDDLDSIIDILNENSYS